MLNPVSKESVDLTQQNIEKLKELFPEILTDGNKINFEMLQTILGEEVDGEKERYSFTWPGKRDAIIGAQQPSKGTLRPNIEKSKNFDTTENLYIEGDNLEVLKLLQKSYNNKIKIIYIDPPYNTGKDFVYKDNFRDGVKNYLEQTGQVDSDGNLLSTNSESNGRFHSDWLNMMYPRIKIARNLLSENGIIFISIDDSEQANLKLLCDEIFGERNKISTIANISNPKGRSDSKFIATGHEYIHIYAKNINNVNFGGFKLDEKIVKRYNKIDENGRKYRETDLKKGGFGDRRQDRPAMFYYFVYDEKTGELYPSKKIIEGKVNIAPIKSDGSEGRWRWGFENAVNNVDKLLARPMNNSEQWSVYEKDYLDKRDKAKAPSYWTYKDINNERGVEQFTKLGFNKEIFDNPKPKGLIKRIMELSEPMKGDIVLDFFSGSGTTAEAVLEKNLEDGINRKFILVQLPEQLSREELEKSHKLKTIADIATERIKRAGERLLSENSSPELQIDTGFKYFELDKSNIKEWNTDFESLEEEFELFAEVFVNGRSELDIVYEIMLKNGLELTLPISSFDVNGKTVYDIAFGLQFICLSDDIDTNVAKAIINKRDEYGIDIISGVVFKDASFNGNDSEKLNCIQLLKDAGFIEENLQTI